MQLIDKASEERLKLSLRYKRPGAGGPNLLTLRTESPKQLDPRVLNKMNKFFVTLLAIFEAAGMDQQNMIMPTLIVGGEEIDVIEAMQTLQPQPGARISAAEAAEAVAKKKGGEDEQAQAKSAAEQGGLLDLPQTATRS